MDVDLKSPARKPSKTYGKKSAASSSSSAARISSFNSNKIDSSSSSSSSEDDSDNDVINSLKPNYGNGLKGKGKEIASRSSSSLTTGIGNSNNKFNSSNITTPSRSQSTPTSKSTLSSTLVKLIAKSTTTSTTTLNSSKNVEGKEIKKNVVEWDEEVAVVDRSTTYSTNIIKSTIIKVRKVSPSPEPVKRPRVPFIFPSQRQQPIASTSKSSPPVYEDTSDSTPNSKRIKVNVTKEIPAIVHTSASSISIRSSPNKYGSKQHISSPSNSPSKVAQTSRLSRENSTTPSILSPPRSPNRIAIVKPILLSPAKDLSNLFEQFTNAGNSGDEKEKGSGKSSSLISGMSSRSPSKLSKKILSPSRTPPLVRANSFPLLSSPSSANSNNPQLHSTTSLTQLSVSVPGSPLRNDTTTSTTRSLVRANTTLGISQSNNAVESEKVIVPRGVMAASSSKRTYGGGARSFKRDIEEEKMFGILPIEDHGSSNGINSSSNDETSSSRRKSILQTAFLPYKEKESYATLRNKWGVDEEEELDEFNMENNEGNELKSVAHLREKGENTRFGDEFCYLVEGLEKEMGVGVRRASAIEVLRKMLENDFVRRLLASGFVERLFIDFRKAEAGDGDRVLDPAIVLLIILLAKDQRIAEPLLRIPSNKDENISDVLIVLSNILNQKSVGEEISGSGTPSKLVSKTDLRSLASLRVIIDKSNITQQGSFPITLRSLTLIALSIYASFTPRSIFKPQIAICSSGALDSVVLSFLKDTAEIEQRITRYESGLDLLPSDGTLNLSLIDTCLGIFEACSSATESQCYKVLLPQISSLASTLSHLISACHILASDSSNPNLNSIAMDCLLSGLRMLIDLTTNHSEWCRELIDHSDSIVGTLVKIIAATRVKNQVVVDKSDKVKSKIEVGDDGEVKLEADGTEKESSVVLRFDLLCLALGVLTNLVETVDSTKDVLRETLIDMNCKESRKCARKCQCSNRKSAIYRLTDLYLDPLEDSSNELNTSFINGYSGILLGLIMIDSIPNQVIITEALSDHPVSLKNLITAMEEFATLHDQTDQIQKEQNAEEFEAGVEGEEEEIEPTQIVDEYGMQVESLIIVEKKEDTVALRIRRMLDGLK